MKKGQELVNAASVDVEDYFQVSAFQKVISRDEWHTFPPRVEANTRRLLALLDRTSVTATFFVLGWIAERWPGLIRDVQAAGHELAVHGYDHREVTSFTPGEFRDDVRRARQIVEDITGIEVIGYRAPSYSIVKGTLWAADILLEEGFLYDSSIFPIFHDRYGIPSAPRFPWTLSKSADCRLVEFPISTLRVAGLNLPFLGGGYLRHLPFPFIVWGLRRLNRVEGKPAILYTHPWEIDPQQPRQPARFLTRLRHYRNLDKTETRLAALFARFRFAPVREVLGL